EVDGGLAEPPWPGAVRMVALRGGCPGGDAVAVAPRRDAGSVPAPATGTRLRLGDELGDKAGVESFDAFLRAVAAFLHAAEWRFGHRDHEAVDAEHARLHLLANQVHPLRVLREGVG